MKFISYCRIILLIAVFLMVGSSVSAAESGLRINEIAWMGTKESYADEWIELYNPTEEEINLEKWSLVTEDEDLNINLKGTIEPQSFFILERTDDETLPEIKADQTYTGGLNDNGQYLKLKKNEEIIQEINDKAGWRAGGTEKHKTMERGEEWHTSRKTGGTPGKVNSEPELEEEQMPAKPLTASLPRTSDFWFTLLVASGMSLFSAAVIYFLKWELSEASNN